METWACPLRLTGQAKPRRGTTAAGFTLDNAEGELPAEPLLNDLLTFKKLAVVPLPDSGTKNGGGPAGGAARRQPTVRAGTFKTTTDVCYMAAFRGVMRISASDRQTIAIYESLINRDPQVGGLVTL
jgi:hypothetical protein